MNASLEFPQLFHADAAGAPTANSALDLSHLQGASDVQAVGSWLSRFQGSAHTVDAARKEAERFLLWLLEQGLSLRTLRPEDLSAYVEFLRDPQPADRWVGAPKPRVMEGRPNPDWRPFAGPLAPSSVKQASTILFGMFEYLVVAGYLSANLWRLLQRQKVQKTEQIERYLPNEARNALFMFVRDKAHGVEAPPTFADFRNQWLIALFYLSGARRSEVAQGRMSDLYRDDTGWWWRITGKGGKTGDVPLTREFLDQLKAYRLALGMPALPSPAETEIPLVGDAYTGRRPLSASAIYKLVKGIFEDVAARQEDPFVKATLQEASPHWLRHTAASDQLNEAGIGVAAVSKNLRHSDISTTTHYLHVDRNQRHAETQKHQLPSPSED